MFYEYLKEIDRVDVYAAIGFFIFFLFFILVSIHTFKLKKADTDKMSRLPLDDEYADVQE